MELHGRRGHHHRGSAPPGPQRRPSIIKVVEREFKKRGIKSSLGKFFKTVEQDANGAKVTLEDGTVFEADIVLVAVGRGPNTEGFGYDEQGLTMDRGFVITNERLHTGVGNIYAIGDIVPGVQLAHRGYQQAASLPKKSQASTPDC